MTKSSFIALADSIRQHNETCIPQARFSPATIATLADFCQAQNPAFKRDRWLDYIAGKCGKNGGAAR